MKDKRLSTLDIAGSVPVSLVSIESLTAAPHIASKRFPITFQLDVEGRKVVSSWTFLSSFFSPQRRSMGIRLRIGGRGRDGFLTTWNFACRDASTEDPNEPTSSSTQDAKAPPRYSECGLPGGLFGTPFPQNH